jgi:hypothetical protein
MPSKRRVDKKRAVLSGEAIDWLEGGKGGSWFFFQTEEERAALWREYGPEIVEEHIGEAPGMRPRLWWKYDAPGPRQRVGGVGTPSHERLAVVPWHEFGVPTQWVTERTLRLYEKLDCPLNVPAIDPADPPTFESGASYLRRHGLLAAGEEKRLIAADFGPETVATAS